MSALFFYSCETSPTWTFNRGFVTVFKNFNWNITFLRCKPKEKLDKLLITCSPDFFTLQNESPKFRNAYSPGIRDIKSLSIAFSSELSISARSLDFYAVLIVAQHYTRWHMNKSSIRSSIKLNKLNWVSIARRLVQCAVNASEPITLICTVCWVIWHWHR